MRRLLRGAFRSRHLDIKVPKHRRLVEPWVGPHTLRGGLKLYPNAAGICGHRVVPFMGLESVVPEIRYFTILRDPLKRCVSHFLHAQRGRVDSCHPSDLMAFCQKPEIRNLQCQHLAKHPDAGEAIATLGGQVGFVGLSERFDESLLMLRTWLEAPVLPTQGVAVNSCKARPAWAILEDPELRAVVEEANEQDLLLYQHVVNHIFPVQEQKYQDRLAEPIDQREPEQGEGWWAAGKRNLLMKPAQRLRLV